MMNTFVLKIKSIVKKNPYLLRVARLVLNFIQELMYKNSELIAVSIPDIFLTQYGENCSEFNRYDIIVRYLAVENYYAQNNIGYVLYQKMQKKRGDYDSIEQFKRLIESYDKIGYDAESVIICDKNLHLVDGSHRIALGLYHGIDSINISILKHNKYIDYSLDWFIKAGFSETEIRIIKDKYAEVTRKINDVTFTCILWPPVSEYFDVITKDLEYLTNVTGYRDYTYTDCEFANMVRAIYDIDDIDKWKIEKKIEYMSNYDKKIRVLQLNINNPRYRVKSINKKPLSVECERLKSVIRTRYASEIDNYYYDIIMHISDNLEQSRYMQKIYSRFENISIDTNLAKEIKKLRNLSNTLSNGGICVLFGSIFESWEDITQKIGSEFHIVGSFEVTLNAVSYYNLLSDIFRTYEKMDDILNKQIDGLMSEPFKTKIILVCDNSSDNIYQHMSEYMLGLLNGSAILYHNKGIYATKNNIDYCYLRKILLSSNNLKYLALKKTYESRTELVKRIQTYIKVCNQHGVPLDDVCVVGGCVMDSMGIRRGNDFDTIASTTLQINSQEKIYMLEKADYHLHKFKFYRGWNISDDEFINNEDYHYIYAGCKFINLEIVYEYKSHLMRKHDIPDLIRILDFWKKYA